MFAPNKTWRRWHRSPNQTQKRHAMASSIAASALPALVMARGHRIADVPEMPLIVDDSFEKVNKTKVAVEFLTKLGLAADLNRVKETRHLRCGSGKGRNRRYVTRKGPLVVYAEDNGIVHALRNIPGVDLCHVDRLNLLQTAPGGTFGRMIVWTETAAKKLNEVFGSFKVGAPLKKGYRLLRPQMTNADLAAIINSDEIQSALRPAKEAPKKSSKRRVATSSRALMCKLNPLAATNRKYQIAKSTPGTKTHAYAQKKTAQRAAKAKTHSAGAKHMKTLLNSYKPTPAQEQ
jgi:large subunit ribosomal protein L4e